VRSRAFAAFSCVPVRSRAFFRYFPAGMLVFQMSR
jgi:hypothetical protein